MTGANPNVVALMYWQKRHKEILDQPYLTTYGKDTRLLKDIINVYNLEQVMRFIDIFFGMLLTDDFLQNSGATIGVFKTQIPKILMHVREQGQQKEQESMGKL